MPWAYMAASGTQSVVFIDDMTADRSSRMNSEVYRTLLSAAKLIGWYFKLQMNNGPRPTAKATQKLLKKIEYSSMAKSVF